MAMLAKMARLTRPPLDDRLFPRQQMGGHGVVRNGHIVKGRVVEMASRKRSNRSVSTRPPWKGRGRGNSSNRGTGR